jgi:Mg2+ and Co2+ transporter CorA
VLPARVAEALGELVGAAREGLLALSVGVGMGVLVELLEEEVADVVGSKGKHDADRVAVRHGHEAGEVTLGGRRMPVDRPRARSADGAHEVELLTYQHFPDRDPLTMVVMERMLAGVSVRRYRRAQEPVGAEVELLLYRVVDGLVDSFFPILAAVDNRIDDLEDQIFLRADDRQLQEILRMKRLLVGMRKAVTPQRDTFASLMGRVAALPGLEDEDERYFRDVYDHLIRISDLIDSYRDLLTGAMDVYLSAVSNRLNSVMKQLTVIATIFLPLTFITGFFGQNFGWIVDNIGGLPAFLALGIGIEIPIVVALLTLFKRRGWF